MKKTFLIIIIIAAFGFLAVSAMHSPEVKEEPSTTQGVTINGVTITPLEIMEDSRCPEGVQCIWAGTVKLKANLRKPSGNYDAVLELGKAVSTGTEEVTLVSVTPNPKEGKKIAFDDYDFEFTVVESPASAANPGTTVTNPDAEGCYVGGCSGQLCTEERGAVSTCEYTEAYSCYATAKCAKLPNGKCGWVPTASLNKCLDDAR